ncbi:MAG: hypothetical protein ABFS41_12990 [Myxococcota bacterium]
MWRQALSGVPRAAVGGVLLAAAAAALFYGTRPLDAELASLRERVTRPRDLAGFVDVELAELLRRRPDVRARGERSVRPVGCPAAEALDAWSATESAALTLTAADERFALAFDAARPDCDGADCFETLHAETGLSKEALVARLRELGCAAGAGLEWLVRSERAALAFRFDEWGCLAATSTLARDPRGLGWPEPAPRPSRCALYPERYRLASSGSHWDVVGTDPVVADLQSRYPDYFAVILDPEAPEEPNLRRLRDDLERPEVDRRNFDALNAVAIGYFELNYRAQNDLGGRHYLSDSFRAAKLIAVPWRAYGEIQDARLRDAILDFFEDAATGEKLAARETAGRLERVIAALEPKEPDEARQRRIRRLLRRLGSSS